MGASHTTVSAYIADVSDAKTRAQNFGLMGMAFGMGFVFGPALGGLLGSVDIRLPFFVAAALALVNWLYGFFVLPESLPVESRGRFEWRKANPWSSIANLRLSPLVAGLAVALVLSQLAQRGMETSWVLYTGYRYGWGELANGLALTLLGLTVAFVQGYLIRLVIPRLGERRTVIVGMVIGTFAYLGYGLATEGWMLLVILVLGSLGGIAGPAIQGMIAGSVGPSDQGKVQGALTSLMSLTAIFAPLIFTAGLFSYFTSEAAPIELPGAPFLAGSLLVLAALVVMVRLFRRIPPQETESEAGDEPAPA
jgi:DHA1 family tetracycline resistance protein-like MFS transporter